jgi:mono/diheme cytochrome c family protein
MTASMRQARSGWIEPGPPVTKDRVIRGCVVVAVAGIVALLAVGCGSAASDDAAVVQRGAELYEANCASCHGWATGGAISDIPPRHNAEGHTWHHGDCVLAEIVRDGPAPRPEAGDDVPTMPAFGDQLSDEDIDAILVFVRTWWTDEQREFQAERTTTDCNGG